MTATDRFAGIGHLVQDVQAAADFYTPTRARATPNRPFRAASTSSATTSTDSPAPG